MRVFLEEVVRRDADGVRRAEPERGYVAIETVKHDEKLVHAAALHDVREVPFPVTHALGSKRRHQGGRRITIYDGPTWDNPRLL